MDAFTAIGGVEAEDSFDKLACILTLRQHQYGTTYDGTHEPRSDDPYNLTSPSINDRLDRPAGTRVSWTAASLTVSTKNSFAAERAGEGLEPLTVFDCPPTSR